MDLSSREKATLEEATSLGQPHPFCIYEAYAQVSSSSGTSLSIVSKSGHE